MDILIKILTREELSSHIPEFVDILKEEPYEYWQEQHFETDLPRKFDLSVVAFTGRAVAGYIIASLKETGPYIHKFMVRKNLRNMSIGKKMLDYFENNLAGNGYAEIKLTVREENDMGIRFYVRNSFKITDKRTDTKDKAVLLVMTKQI